MNPQQLTETVAAHVRGFFEVHPDPSLLYHNLAHTQSVVAAAGRIADHYHLSSEDYAVVSVAAWFHDCGYLLGPASSHEEQSALYAAGFLSEQGCDEAFVAQVQGCIRATHMPQRPANLLEQIVCDADVFHFGTEDFKEKNKLMHREAELRKGVEIPAANWREGTIRLLQAHQFQTEYCQVLLKKGKEENLERLIAKSEKKNGKDGENTGEGREPEASKKARKKDAKTERGVETMYRITSGNHLRLSSMADNKAHILITVNSIIISVIVSLVVRKLDSQPHLLIPIVILLSSSLVAIIFSIMVTRPNVTKGISTREDITQRRSNLLFFGNFYNMKQEDYEWGMREMRKDVEFVYDSMSRDIYFLGKVLARKYHLLHKAYNCFMFGLVISVIALVIAQSFYAK